MIIRISKKLTALILTLTLAASSFAALTQTAAAAEPSKTAAAAEPSKTAAAADLSRMKQVDLLKSKKKTYCILAVGNSLNYESVHYLRRAARTAGYKIIVGVCYSSGTSIREHYKYCSNNKSRTMEYREYNAKGVSGWTKPSFRAVLKKHKWDAVLIEPTFKLWNTGYLNENGDSYLTLMSDLIKSYYRKRGKKAPLIGANLAWVRRKGCTDPKFTKIWNSSSKAMYEDMIKVWQDALRQAEGIDFYVSTATAVQNARKTRLTSRIYRDGRHVSYGYGRFLAAMCVLKALGMDLRKVKTIRYDKKAGRTSRKNTPLLKKCAYAAARRPFSVSKF